LFCFIGYPRGPFSGDFFKYQGMFHRRLKKKVKRIILISFLLLFILLLTFGGLWIYRNWPDPPVNELKAAREVITLARDAGASHYAPKLFGETSRLYNAAMLAWKTENQHFILNRNFSKTRSLALQTVETGLRAYEKAAEKAKTITQTTGLAFDELGKIVHNFESVYSPLPLQKTLRESFNKAVLLLTEARLAREKSDFSLAESKLSVAKEMLVSADQKARKMMENYFGSYPQWTALIKDAVSKSANQNSTVFIVDKMAHKFRIYNNGQLKYTFDAEFGPNWMGQKQYRGDHATPEGLYQVVNKKDRRSTAYYKALLLNYPNEEDRVRYRRNISSGRASSRTDLGGSIEIHGNGGRGFDWTNGCIGLANRDMDVVFNMASVRTPVVIVGSVEPLDKYMVYAGQEKNRN